MFWKVRSGRIRELDLPRLAELYHPQYVAEELSIRREMSVALAGSAGRRNTCLEFTYRSLEI